MPCAYILPIARTPKYNNAKTLFIPLLIFFVNIDDFITETRLFEHTVQVNTTGGIHFVEYDPSLTFRTVQNPAQPNAPVEISGLQKDQTQ